LSGTSELGLVFKEELLDGFHRMRRQDETKKSTWYEQARF
jgi:hypothetical protein